MTEQFITIQDYKICYLEQGTGPAVLLLHGFPTSSHLWRNIIPTLAKHNRVIAIDLPGYGKSDKPLTSSYSLNFYAGILSELIQQLKLDPIHLGVHDAGGPIGLLWAVRNQEKIKSLLFLNTLVYSDFSWGVILFGLAMRMPILKQWIVSPSGIEWAMKFGVQRKSLIQGDVLAPYVAPFQEKPARTALIKAITNFSIKGFQEIEKHIAEFKVPVRIIYGDRDRILPKVARTMQRLKGDLPQAEITVLPNCGHFLQEDKPEELGALMRAFVVRVDS